MSKKIAVFPGSFDPITIGHVDIIRRALPLFDEIIIAIGHNTQKKYLFAPETRMGWIEKFFSSEKKIKIAHYEGLTIRFCSQAGAAYIIRGLRTSADFEFERGIAQMNRAMDAGIETLFIIARPEFSAISSTIVRDIIRHGGDASQFVPEGIALNP